MDFDNRLRRTLGSLDRFPASLRGWLRTKAIGRTIHFVGTAGLGIDELSAERAVISIVNRRRVQNHIGTVHAAAMALVAETASGLALGMHLHDGAVPVIKRMSIDYVRRAKGDLRAVAQLTPEQQRSLQNDERGELLVAVGVSDSEGAEPIQCQMLWAWTPKRR